MRCAHNLFVLVFHRPMVWSDLFDSRFMLAFCLAYYSTHTHVPLMNSVSLLRADAHHLVYAGIMVEEVGSKLEVMDENVRDSMFQCCNAVLLQQFNDSMLHRANYPTIQLNRRIVEAMPQCSTGVHTTCF